VTEGKLLTYW